MIPIDNKKPKKGWQIISDLLKNEKKKDDKKAEPKNWFCDLRIVGK
jgi:hypothetical protein